MSDSLDDVRAHYRGADPADALVERLAAALAPLGLPTQRLQPRQLATLDHFHTRGLAATADLARLAGFAAGARVLDIGCGVGGPARFLAESCGCRVTGIDLSPSFVAAARYLTARTDQQDVVDFETGSALALPFEAATFDGVLLQHVAMNIADRAGLYREIRRVLRPGGRFATYDVVRAGGEPHYPVPWARTPATSVLLTVEETRAAVEAAGFRTLAFQDDSEAARAWVAQIKAAGAPTGPGLGVLMGPDFAQLAANLGRSLVEGRVAILSAVFVAQS